MAQSVRYGENHQLRLCEVKENINVILLSSDLISFLFVFLFFSRSLFDWTRTIHSSELKIAVDFAICSVCRHYPDIFTSLLSSVTSASSSSPSSLNSVLQSKSLMETLGRAAQSESALNKLVQSGLLNYVSLTITGKSIILCFFFCSVFHLFVYFFFPYIFS